MRLGVLGTDRPDGHRIAADFDVGDQFRWIRRDRQVAGRLIRPAQPHPGIDRHHTARIGEQRRHVQHRDLREVDDQLADPHQRLGNRIDIGDRTIPHRPLQQRANAAAANQGASEGQVQRR